MEYRIHPTYQKNLQKNSIVIWLTAVISLCIGIYLYKIGYEAASGAVCGIFFLSAIGGSIYLRYSLRHVKCLACNRLTKTKLDSTKSNWVAVCNSCNIEWDLKTGIADTN
jgi:hypothetical protein